MAKSYSTEKVSIKETDGAPLGDTNSTVDVDISRASITTSKQDIDQDTKVKTRLGSNNTLNSKLTLRDLGRYMSERMMKSMVQDKITRFGKAALGSPVKDDNAGNYYSMYEGTSGNTAIDRYVSRFGTIADNPEITADYVSKSPGLKLGEAMVINPDFQFNEMDDVRSDFRRPKIGRLYSERIYDYNLPIIFFQPGRVYINMGFVNQLMSLAKMRNVAAYANKESLNLQDYLKGNSKVSELLSFCVHKIGVGLGFMIGNGAKTALDNIKWYKFIPESLKYMRFVNEILEELAMWMGLYQSDIADKVQAELNKFLAINLAKSSEADSEVADDDTDTDKSVLTSIMKLIKGETDGTTSNETTYAKETTSDSSGFPEINGYIGGAKPLSVINILPQYAKLSGSSTDTQPVGTTATDDIGGTTNHGGWEVIDTTIPFGLSKGISVSESFSNSTGAHPLTEQFNQAFEESNQSKLVGSFGKLGQAFSSDTAADIANKGGEILTGGDPVGDAKAAAADLAMQTLQSGAAGLINMIQQKVANVSDLGDVGMVINGSGRFILPEVWNDSSFDRSYSVSFKFRSPYGNKLSIFENCMIPLIFLIAMTDSRKVGLESYTSPFYCKVFAKGFFSCELGMITSLSMSRGEGDSNDRTVDGFFRTMNVSLTIKDMLPNISMGMDAGVFGLNKNSNNGFMNFLLNIAGIDFVERAQLGLNAMTAVTHMQNTVENFGPNVNLWLRGTPPGKMITKMATMFSGSKDPMSAGKGIADTF